jgi:hypothetical protein
MGRLPRFQCPHDRGEVAEAKTVLANFVAHQGSLGDLDDEPLALQCEHRRQVVGPDATKRSWGVMQSRVELVRLARKLSDRPDITRVVVEPHHLSDIGPDDHSAEGISVWAGTSIPAMDELNAWKHT